MAMTMEELFYGGEREPAYFAHNCYGESASAASFYNCNGRRAAPALVAPRAPARSQMVSFDLMVPMCCARCEDQVRGALYALRGLRDVVCDARNQRVTVTGCLDPALALEQVRRVKSGAVFWLCSSRYQVSSCRKPQQDRSRSYVQSGDAYYSRSLCPAYRDGAKTYFVSLNCTIETVEVRGC